MTADATSLAKILDLANILVQEPDGTILYWSSGCERLYGWKSEEAVGRTTYELLETVYPVPRDDLLQALRDRGAWEGEIVHHTRAGWPLTIRTLCVARKSEDGELRSILQNNIDISGQKRAQDDLMEREALLRSILDTVPEAMIIIDERGLIQSFSAAAAELFGYRRDEVIGENVRILMPEPYKAEHDTYIDNYLRTGERRIIGYGRLVKAITKDGTVFPIELSIGEARSKNRRMFTGFVRDLTSRQKMEEELRQSQKMEAVGQLTGGLAHDFNNILTAIIANIELLAPNLVDPDDRDLAMEAHEAARDGAKLAGQLLAFGRRQPLNSAPTDVGALLTSFSGLLRRTLGETVELRIEVPPDPQVAVIDGAQLQNALLNLAINARDAMPRGGKLTIETSTVRLDSDYAQTYPEVRTGRYILITVTDNGSGMSEEVRRRAFEPFFTTKPTGAGSGLGLSMVYGFVKQTGGHIQIYSEVARGTSVRLFMPRAEGSAGDRASRSPDTQATDLAHGSETILLVEDDPRLRRVLGRRLRTLGYQVIETDNGAAAMAEVARRPEIALVFTDMVMPGGMTGLELADAARTIRPGLKILFTSGYAAPELARLGQQKGTWLKKPYTADELADKIRHVLEEPR